MMNLNFTVAEKCDIPKLKALWSECFDEVDMARDLFFKMIAEKNFCSVCCAKDGRNIISALYLVKGLLNGQKAHYLCGAATKPQYRGRGIMAELIEYALNQARKSGDKYSLLFPANDSLYGFYEKFGYYRGCSAKRVEFSRADLTALNLKSSRLDCKDFEEMQKMCFKDNFLLQNNKFIEFAAEYYGVYGVKSVKGKNCFFLFENSKEKAEVFYSAFSDAEEMKTLLLKNTDVERFVFLCKADTEKPDGVKNEKYGMIKSLGNTGNILKDVYIGITLN